MAFWTRLREQLSADPQRPRYHFLPRANWLNDPNGLFFWKGKHHLFYQHNPYAPFHGGITGTMHWGHAISEDLVHWDHLPIALAPTPGGPDKNGVYSGSMVEHDGIPTIVYTGVWPEVQCIATSNDDMLTWKKRDANPVLESPPEGLELTGFRDPCAWREEDGWYMLVGSGIKGRGGTGLLYRSQDLANWEYMHPLCVGYCRDTGDRWDCPDFFPLDNRHVLLVSAWEPPHPPRRNPYLIGEYADHRFQPEVQRDLDLGGYYYAAKSMVDGRGRRVVFGWVLEARSAASQWAPGWSGVMSLPRVLSLDGNNRLRMGPLPELASLRGSHHQYGNVEITSSGSPSIDVRGDCLEILVEFLAGDASEFGLKLRCAPDESEQTLICYDSADKCLKVNRQRSSLSPEVDRHEHGGQFGLAPDENLRLHIFLDRSVIEVFANDRVCLTSRIYPTKTTSLGIGLFAFGGSVRLNRMDIWEMRSIWEG